jgi:hypothetical protein
LAQVRGPLGIGIERDRHWKPGPVPGLPEAVVVLLHDDEEGATP